MIIDKYKCIYTNVPKTGSRSIKKYLGIEETHFPLCKEKIKDEDKFNNYFKFSFVRNPWDRLVSTFTYLSKGGINDSDKKDRDTFIKPFNFNFKDFVLALNNENIFEQVHLKPQYYWLCEENSSKLIVDFIGKFELYENDWLFIQNKLDIDSRIEPSFNTFKNKIKKSFLYKRLYNIETAKKIVHKINMSNSVNKIGKKTNTLPHVNKSNHKHYSEYYDNQTKEYVENLYHIDIKLFDYNFK